MRMTTKYLVTSVQENAPAEVRIAQPLEATASFVAACPEFLRLPKPGSLCPHSGLSRSYINSLILPSRLNDFKPPVRSFVIRRPGAKTGVRLIDYASLRRFILLNQATNGQEGGVQ